MTTREFDKWMELCAIGDEMQLAIKMEKIKSSFMVKWEGSIGMELDGFDYLCDAELFAGLVSGRVIA